MKNKKFRKTQSKTSFRFLLIRDSEWISREQMTRNVGEDVGKEEPAYIADKNVNFYCKYGNQYGYYI